MQQTSEHRVRRVGIALVGLLIIFLSSSGAPAFAGDKAGDAKKAFEEAKRLSTAKSYRDAIKKYERALELWTETGDVAGQVAALVGIGQEWQIFGKDFQKALEYYTKARALAETAGDEKQLAAVLGDVATAEKLLEHKDESLAAYEAQLQIYQKLEDHLGEAATLSNLAGAYFTFGDEAKAAEYRKRAADARARYNLPPLSVRVSGGVLATKARRRIQPSYPIEARRNGTEGTVTVEVAVSTTGTVESVRVLNGPSEFHDVCIEAARQWLFEPTRLNGEPVRMVGTITFRFAKM